MGRTITLEEFLQKSGCSSELAQLLTVGIAPAVISIKKAISHQGGEFAGTQNFYGEEQLALDVRANQIVVDSLTKCGLVSWLSSEELEKAIETPHKDAPFNVAFDPLDGSSLVDVNFAVGSIFGVYEWPRERGELVGNATGDDQVAACYSVYGPHTTLVLTIRKGVHEFRLHEDGKFYLTKENISVDPDAKHFAPGNLRAAAERRDYLELTNRWIQSGLTLRYSGGMVPDINHILLKGNGIFAYPSYSKAPQGKLRLLFECAPMALLMEQAGGSASDGEQGILSKKISELHQRTPMYVGSRNAVDTCCKALSP